MPILLNLDKFADCKGTETYIYRSASSGNPSFKTMNHVVRSVSHHRPSAVFLSSKSNRLGRRTTASVISFRQATTTVSSTPENPHNMDKTQNPDEKTEWGDVMSHSFGEGYATRSDEEGFGGIYGGNQSERKEKIHENHPGAREVK
ncbi:uncharacterized protein LOC110627506 isoform X2 [Manihot esculenta]|nr:uncharacterized protein LOC110627506 isoform X2 [Manihot esculenta]